MASVSLVHRTFPVGYGTKSNNTIEALLFRNVPSQRKRSKLFTSAMVDGQYRSCGSVHDIETCTRLTTPTGASSLFSQSYVVELSMLLVFCSGTGSGVDGPRDATGDGSEATKFLLRDLEAVRHDLREDRALRSVPGYNPGRDCPLVELLSITVSLFSRSGRSLCGSLLQFDRDMTEDAC